MHLFVNVLDLLGLALLVLLALVWAGWALVRRVHDALPWT